MTATIAKIETLTLAEIAAAYNQLSERPVKKFSDRETAQRRLAGLIPAGHVVLRDEDGTISVVDKKSAPKPERRRPEGPQTRTELTDDLVITVLVESNPKRGLAAARFGLYKTGMTIAQFKTAAHKLELGVKPAFKYLSDIRWDLEHGLISVAPAAKQ